MGEMGHEKKKRKEKKKKTHGGEAALARIPLAAARLHQAAGALAVGINGRLDAHVAGGLLHDEGEHHARVEALARRDGQDGGRDVGHVALGVALGEHVGRVLGQLDGGRERGGQISAYALCRHGEVTF